MWKKSVLVLALAAAACASAWVAPSLADSHTHRHRQPSWEQRGRLKALLHTRPRAYPERSIDRRARLEHIEILRAERARLAGGGTLVHPSACTWISSGPTNVAGRITGISIAETNRDRIFVSSVGGIWRSLDRGRSWDRVSDDMIPGPFGAVAIAPHDENEVWAGGGDPNLFEGGGGPGLWNSGQGGADGSWKQIWVPQSLDAIVFRILIDPQAPHDVYFATSEGLFRYERSDTPGVVSEWNAPCSDLVIDFNEPLGGPTFYAAGYFTGGPHDQPGISRRVGSNANWNAINTGIDGTIENLALAMAPTDSKVLYAKVVSRENYSLLGVYRWLDGDEQWDRIDDDVDADGFTTGTGLDDTYAANVYFTYYNCSIAVDPQDKDIVYVGGESLFRGQRGATGYSWKPISEVSGATSLFPKPVPHIDHHAITFDPVEPKFLLTGNDGGLDRGHQGEDPWIWEDLSHGMLITEFYGVTTQHATASLRAGGTQDNGSMITFGNRSWHVRPTCDGDDVDVDAENSLTLYESCNWKFKIVGNPVPGTQGYKSPVHHTVSSADDLLHLVVPMATHPTEPRHALVGAVRTDARHMVARTTDGVNFAAATPGITLGAGEVFSTFGIAPSSLTAFYAGSLSENEDAETIKADLHYRDHQTSSTWAVSPPLSVNAIAVDGTSTSRAFAALGGNGGTTGRVLMTTNAGQTWQEIQDEELSKIPATGIVIDPYESNRVYISTDRGVWVGERTGGDMSDLISANPEIDVNDRRIGSVLAAWTWSEFNEGLPEYLDVNDIAVNKKSGTLLIGTMGYGTFSRIIDPSVACRSVMLSVRDNVFDQAVSTAPFGVRNPEVPDGPDADGFFVPHPDVYLNWWSSPDIRVGEPRVPSEDGVHHRYDHVEFEGCVLASSECPPPMLMDQNPLQSKTTRAYVQVTNLGRAEAGKTVVLALWAPAATGLPPLPSDFWTTTFTGPDKPIGILDPTSPWKWVNSSKPSCTLSTIHPDRPEVAEFAFVVPDDAVSHSCMLVISESLDDPLPNDVRAANITNTGVLVRGQRHVALRNLTIVDTRPMSTRAYGDFRMRNNSREGSGSLSDLSVAMSPSCDRCQLIVVLPISHAWPPRAWGHVRLSDEEQAFADRLGPKKPRPVAINRHLGTIRRVPVPPDQDVRIGWILRRPEGHDTAHRLDFKQSTQGSTTGGTTFIVRAGASN